jgi:predicted DNA-binding transcriptional regulator YafY
MQQQSDGISRLQITEWSYDMDTLYRHWLILRMIPRRTRISTTEIRERLKSGYGIETTLRTIQRDLITLEASEFPLECDNNRPAGWSWSKDAPAFDIPNMDPVTALTFKLAEKHVARMMPHGVMSALKPYIKAADERLRLTATVPADFDLDAYIATELTFPVGGKINLKVLFGNKADIQRLEEAPLCEDQRIVMRNDGTFELTATVEDTLQLHWWLRGYGARVEIVAPESLRKEFADMAKELAERYRVIE